LGPGLGRGGDSGRGRGGGQGRGRDRGRGREGEPLQLLFNSFFRQVLAKGHRRSNFSTVSNKYVPSPSPFPSFSHSLSYPSFFLLPSSFLLSPSSSSIPQLPSSFLLSPSSFLLPPSFFLLPSLIPQIFKDSTIIEDYLHKTLKFKETGMPIEFDIWIPQYDLAFEFQGKLKGMRDW
jgi:hypothetical protein